MVEKKTAIILGYSCNNNCTFCCMSDRRKKIKDKITEEVKKDIFNAKERGTTYLEFVGGEPTIRKDIFEIVRFANKLGFSTIMLATNGRVLSNIKFARKLIESGVNHIVFSVHGHISELHDSLTKVPGSFEQVIRGIKNVQKLGLNNIGTNTTIVQKNYKKLPLIGKFIYNLGIRNAEFIYAEPTHGKARHDFFSIVPLYPEAFPYINNLLSFGKGHGIEHWHIRYYPLCFIEEKYHDMVSEINEKKIFNTSHLAPDFINMDVSTSRKNMGRSYINRCNKCKYKGICEGYWNEYIKKALVIKEKKSIHSIVSRGFLFTIFNRIINSSDLLNNKNNIIDPLTELFQSVKNREAHYYDISYSFSKDNISPFRFVFYDSEEMNFRIFPQKILKVISIYHSASVLNKYKQVFKQYGTSFRYHLGFSFKDKGIPTIKTYFWLGDLGASNDYKLDVIKNIISIFDFDFDKIYNIICNKRISFLCVDLTNKGVYSIKIYTQANSFLPSNLEEELHRNKLDSAENIMQLKAFFNNIKSFMKNDFYKGYRFLKNELISIKYDLFVDIGNYSYHTLLNLLNDLNYGINNDNIFQLERQLNPNHIIDSNIAVISLDLALKASKVNIYVKPMENCDYTVVSKKSGGLTHNSSDKFIAVKESDCNENTSLQLIKGKNMINNNHSEQNFLITNNLIIVPTLRCNLNCDYCYVDKNSKKKDMDFETVKKAIGYFFTHNKEKRITFYGGEPLLNLELIKKVVSYTDKLEPTYSIYTNALKIDNEILSFLKQKKFYILFSFDGSSKFARGSKIIISKIRENIKKLVDNYPLNRYTCLYTYVEDADLLCDLEELQGLGIKKVSVTPFDMITKIMVDDFKNAIPSLINIKDMDINFKSYDSGDYSNMQIPCDFFNSVLILPNGDLTVCTHFINSKNKPFNIGNIHKDDKGILIKRLSILRADLHGKKPCCHFGFDGVPCERMNHNLIDYYKCIFNLRKEKKTN